jgi:hypothetical protein
MWRDWWAIRKKERAWRKLKAAYDRDIKNAERKGLSRDDIRSIESEAFHFIGEAWHERNLAITWALIHEAERLNVYRPAWGDTEMWEEAPPYTNSRTLNAKGMAAVRQAIRAEREARTSYLRIFTAVCSFISAVAAITAAAAALLGVLR